MLYLETKWASLIPFARATDLLKEVLPVGDLVNAETVRNHLQLTADYYHERYFDVMQTRGRSIALIGLDEFQLAIPRRVALQQGPPPLHQLGAACLTLRLSVEHFSANGKLSLNCLSRHRGLAHSDPNRCHVEPSRSDVG